MRKQNLYYSGDIKDFLNQSTEEILGTICSNFGNFQLEMLQTNAWSTQIEILKRQLANFSSGRIIFEYIIPRMGKRIDVVFLYNNIVFLLEFKCGDTEYRAATFDQVYDYALDLKNFQKESENKLLVPIVVSTKADPVNCEILENEKILAPLKCNENNICEVIDNISVLYKEPAFDYEAWENSKYFPTPTIIESAQALYAGHNVHEITRNDAGATNLSLTSNRIEEIIEYNEIKDKYPILLTRNLKEAKEWVKLHSHGSTRYGLLASSGALRLKPEGIFVKNEIDVANWFLNPKDDVRSSYYLEDVVTEFDIQGLEVDYSRRRAGGLQCIS